jgi:hypothetical protein
MLRITSRSKSPDHRPTLVLEGRLIGPWVEELRRAVRDSRAPHPGCLDLGGLVFADGDGVALLQALRTSGVEIVGHSAFVKELLRL